MIVDNASALEQNAHIALRGKMGKVVETADETVSNAFTAVSSGRSYVGGGENTRRLAAARLPAA